MKILIVNIFGIGDVLFTTPLIASLKKELKDVSIDYVCNSRARGVLDGNPDIDEILLYEKDDYVRLLKKDKRGFIRKLVKRFRKIKEKKYGAVIDLSLSREFGFFFMLAGVPKRIGLDYRKRGMFLTHKKRLAGFENRHVIEYYLDLLAFLDVKPVIRDMQLVIDEEQQEKTRIYLENMGVKKGQFVAIVPGGGASWGQQALRKRWSPSGFAALADMLIKKGKQVALLGDITEHDICSQIASAMEQEPVFIENDLGLGEYISLISMCDKVICNDGGPLHIAIALGVDTVSIFGPVDENVYGPYPPDPRHRVIKADNASCRPCYERFRLPECKYDNICFAGITPDMVMNAVLAPREG